MSAPRPYSDPYRAGAALGLVLLAAFVVVGRGLGASGAFKAVAAGVWREWLVFEIAGVMIGAFLSAFSAGRLRREIERGPNAGRVSRLTMATGGGAVMGIGAVIAGGCTSGLALTGGALLSVGSWIFIGAAFAAAYAIAPLLRKAWQ
jgi:hypothetical protein